MALRAEALSQSWGPGGWPVTARVPPWGIQHGLLSSGPPATWPLRLGEQLLAGGRQAAVLMSLSQVDGALGTSEVRASGG